MLGSKKEKKPGTSALGNVTVYTDGLVHATIYQVSMTKTGEAWGRGNALDDHLMDMQSQGAEILSACPYVFGDSVKVVILYRAPLIEDYRD